MELEEFLEYFAVGVIVASLFMSNLVSIFLMILGVALIFTGTAFTGVLVLGLGAFIGLVGLALVFAFADGALDNLEDSMVKSILNLMNRTPKE